MNLDKIKLQTTWNDAAASLNSNFAKLSQAIIGGGGEGVGQLALVLDFNVDDIASALSNNNGVIEKQTDRKAIIDALTNNNLIVIRIGELGQGYCLVQGEEDEAGTLTIEFDYLGNRYEVTIEEDSIEADRKEIGSVTPSDMNRDFNNDF